MIEIRDLTKNFKEKEIIEKIGERVLKGEKKNNKIVSIVLVGKDRIKSLNKKYRKKDKPTDVLSFSFKDDKFSFSNKELGEVFICPMWIKKEKEDVKRVVIHGILHLLGYDHQKKKEEILMRRKEDFYCKIDIYNLK